MGPIREDGSDKFFGMENVSVSDYSTPWQYFLLSNALMFSTVILGESRA